MPTFILAISDEPFSHDDADQPPFVQVIQHGGDPHEPTTATLAFRRCLDAIHVRSSVMLAQDDGEYDLHEDLDSIAEAVEDGVCVLRDIAAGRHTERFAPEYLPGRLRFVAREAADHLNLVLKTLREIVDWPEPGENPYDHP